MRIANASKRSSPVRQAVRRLPTQQYLVMLIICCWQQSVHAFGAVIDGRLAVVEADEAETHPFRAVSTHRTQAMMATLFADRESLGDNQAAAVGASSKP